MGGSFWEKTDPEKIYEPNIYHAALVNIKDQLLTVDEQGTELTLAGRGAEKEL